MTDSMTGSITELITSSSQSQLSFYTSSAFSYNADANTTPPPIYYGWYSEAIQCLRKCNPTEHPYKNKGIALTSPPYTYWKQGNKLVLVTEITNSAFPTPRQVKNGDIFLGPLDSYHGRSYRRLTDKDTMVVNAPAPASTW
jgi:hypothetical protein